MTDSRTVARSDLGCAFKPSDLILYARDPSVESTFLDDPNRVEGNVWVGRVAFAYEPDAAGQTDPRTGHVQQCVYSVTDPLTVGGSGHRDVKATNVLNEPSDLLATDPFAPKRMKNVYSWM